MLPSVVVRTASVFGFVWRNSCAVCQHVGIVPLDASKGTAADGSMSWRDVQRVDRLNWRALKRAAVFVLIHVRS